MPHSSSHQPSAVSPQPQVDMPFTKADAYAAGSEWGFNCGPGALCAVTGLKPAEIRSAMGDFESKGYTNPRLMREILARLKIKWYAICLDALRPQFPVDRCFPVFGLVRVQWGRPVDEAGRSRASAVSSHSLDRLTPTRQVDRGLRRQCRMRRSGLDVL